MNIAHMKRTAIDSVDALVEAFGGTARLAEFLDVGMSTVSNWKRADDIPPGWHLRLYMEATRRGFDISPDFFGQPETMRPRHKGRRLGKRRRSEQRPAA